MRHAVAEARLQIVRRLLRVSGEVANSRRDPKAQALSEFR